MGGKVNPAASKHLRGSEEDRDCRTADSPGRRRAGKATQVTAAFRPVTQVMVTNGSHRDSRGSGVAGETEAPDSPVPPLCASRDAPEPVLTGSFPARGVTAAVTVATRRPAVPSPPAAGRRLSPLASRLRPPPLLSKRPPAGPAAAGSTRGHSPPPAGRLTSSSGSSSSFYCSRRRYSRRWRHFRSSRPSSSALRRCRGRKIRP